MSVEDAKYATPGSPSLAKGGGETCRYGLTSESHTVVGLKFAIKVMGTER